MYYHSTRGLAHSLSFNAVVLDGLAADGGLYVPQSYPQYDKARLQSLLPLSYPALAFAVMRDYISRDDISDAVLHTLVNNIYTPALFGFGASAHSDTTLITPLHYLGTEDSCPLYLLELSNGPTLAFKDIALQFLGQLFSHLLTVNKQKVNKQKLTIVGATSGDTGSAAEYALCDKENITVFMLSPAGRMSAFQRAQMYSLQARNIVNIAVENSSFDQCQDLVKAINADATFKAQHAIGSVNSINWARLLAQVVYYFSAYMQLVRQQKLQLGNTVSFTVPSGNFGNVCAGHIARQMGLPIAQLVVATNENDILDTFFRTGFYQPRSTVASTSSPSMDIAKASNFERFIADVLQNPSMVCNYFGKVGGFDLSPQLAALKQNFGFASGASNHAQRVATIRDVHQRYQRIIDPHTADGVAVARRHLNANTPMVVLETAQAAKFNDCIQEALQQDAPRPAELQGIEAKPQRVLNMPCDVEALKHIIATYSY